MTDPYRLLLLAQGLTELTDLARMVRPLAQDLDVVVVEEVATAMGHLWMEKLNGPNGFPFHLLVLPEINGREVTDGVAVLRLLSMACCVEVAPVVLTTAPGGDRAMTALRYGAWEYVSLPLFSLEAFVDLLRVLAQDLERWWKWRSGQRQDADCRDGSHKAIVREVVRRFDEIPKVEALCQECGMTLSSLYRHFEAEMGAPVHQVVRRLRLQCARVLLRETEESVSAIAKRLGFSGPQSLTTTFMTFLGCTPLTFRELMRQRGSYLTSRPLESPREPWLGGCPKLG